MSIVSVAVVLIVVGILLWLANTYIPMARSIKKILNIAVVIMVILWLLNIFGVFAGLHNVRIN